MKINRARLGFFVSTLFFSFLAGLGRARAEGSRTDIIDIPTAEVVDHYGYAASFRFYSGGGVLSKPTFGIFPRLNLGFGIDTERFIGSRPTHVNPPTLNVKFRFFDGRRQLPALAIGYDSQGYFYDRTKDKYLQREKGLFLVGGGEIITPGLTLHGGGNIYDFHDNRIFGFAGLSYLIQNVVSLDFEADNLRKARETRFNAGVRCYVTPTFAVDLAGRDLWAAGRDSERIVRLTYYGSF